jgi:hypothetical protein
LADFFLLKQYITLGALSFDAKTVAKTGFYQRKCGRSLLTLDQGQWTVNSIK